MEGHGWVDLVTRWCKPAELGGKGKVKHSVTEGWESKTWVKRKLFVSHFVLQTMFRGTLDGSISTSSGTKGGQESVFKARHPQVCHNHRNRLVLL